MLFLWRNRRYVVLLLFSRLPPKSKLRNRATRKMETSNFSGVTDHKEEKGEPPTRSCKEAVARSTNVPVGSTENTWWSS